MISKTFLNAVLVIKKSLVFVAAVFYDDSVILMHFPYIIFMSKVDKIKDL
jgi:hypothetical protein